MKLPHRPNILVVALQRHGELQRHQRHGARDVEERTLHLQVEVARRALAALARQLRVAAHLRQRRRGLYLQPLRALRTL